MRLVPLAFILSLTACDAFAPAEKPPKKPKPSWIQTRPFPDVRDLSDVSLLAAGLGFIVGTDGTVIRIAQDEFVLEDSGTNEDLESVSTAVDDEGDPVALACGAHGTVIVRQGGDWKAVPSGVDVQLFGAYLASAVDGFVVGDSGTILRWDGAALTLQDAQALQDVPITDASGNPAIGKFPIPEALKAVAGVGLDVWTTGGRGGIYRYHADQDRWLPEDSDTIRPLVSLFAEAGLWAATTDGVLVRSGGDGVWDDTFAVPVPVFLQDAWVRGGDDAYAVGMVDGLFHHLGGGAWERVRLEQDVYLRGVDGAEVPPAQEGDEPGLLVVAVGAGGRVVRGPEVIPGPDDNPLPVDEIDPAQ